MFKTISVLLMTSALFGCANGGNQNSNSAPMSAAQQQWQMCWSSAELSDRSNCFTCAIAHANQVCGPRPQY